MSNPNLCRRQFLPAVLRAFGASLFLALVTPSLLAQSAAKGTISGTVNSKSTGNALQGAHVEVPALNRSTRTDNTGHFVMFDVPAGTVDVMVSYEGFKDAAQSVSVDGSPAPLAFEMQATDILVMDKFTVSSVKEGQALAITEQRNATNVKTVAAMDEWGVLPTQNVAELAMRLPGVSFAVDTDDNVISGVSIRGQAAGFTRLNIDGMSTTGVGGDGRNVTLYSFSGAQYEQIEIIAGQTPDKRADSIGGQLNLVTRSPLAMKEKRRLSYNAGVRWAPPFSDRTKQRADHATHPTGTLSYTELFDVFGGHRNLGFTAIASYAENVNSQASNQLLYRNATEAIVPLIDYADFYGINHRGVMGLLLKADYRVSDRSSLTFSIDLKAGAEPYYRRTTVTPFAGNSVTATLDANGLPTGTGAIMPNFTEHRTDIRAVTGSIMRLQTDALSFYSKNPTFTLSGKNDFGRLKLSYGARYSYMHFDSGTGPQNQGGALNIRTATPIAFNLNNTDMGGKVFTQTSGADIFSAASYLTTTAGSTNWAITKRKTLADITEKSLRFDATYALDTTFPISLKSGFDYSNRFVDQGKGRDRRWTRVVGAPALAGTLVPVTRFEDVNLDGKRLPLFEAASFNGELSNTALWTEDFVFAAARPFISRRGMIEKVPAGYVQAQAQISKLTVLAGVRAEKVDFSAYTYFKRLSTTAADEPDVYKRAVKDYQKSFVPPGNYRKMFPSIHAAYDLTPNLKARASWSTSYGRPTIQQLTPTPSPNDTLLTITSGNGELKPQMASNIDLKLEYVFKSNGLISFGYFKKTIKDYISPTGTIIGKVPNGADNGYDGLYTGYDIIASTNLGTATAEGLEFDYRQRLTFLPGLFKGLTLSANYTALKTDGVFGGTVAKKSNDIPGFIPRTGNLRVLYNYKRFGASAAVNYTSSHIVGFTAIGSPSNFYRDKLITLNTGVTYRLRPEATLYIEVNNITEQGPERYTFTESRIRAINNGGMTVSFGVSGQF